MAEASSWPVQRELNVNQHHPWTRLPTHASLHSLPAECCGFQTQKNTEIHTCTHSNPPTVQATPCSTAVHPPVPWKSRHRRGWWFKRKRRKAAPQVWLNSNEHHTAREHNLSQRPIQKTRRAKEMKCSTDTEERLPSSRLGLLLPVSLYIPHTRTHTRLIRTLMQRVCAAVFHVKRSLSLSLSRRRSDGSPCLQRERWAAQ